MPFFSVIIATYNRADLVRTAIKSVLSQSFTDWELIIIDDGSTDQTGRKIQDLLFNPKIRYIYQDNQGRSSARNNALNIAKGEYSCFLDSDDYYLNNHLEEFHNLILSNKKTDAIYYGNTFEKIEKEIKEFPAYPVPDNNYSFLFQFPIGTPRTCIATKTLKSQLFDPKLSVGEDVELWFRLMPRKLITHNLFTQVFLTHAGRSVNADSDEPILADIQLKKQLLKKYENQINKSQTKAVFAYLYLKLSRLYSRRKKGKAIYNALRVIIYGKGKYYKEALLLILKNIKP